MINRKKCIDKMADRIPLIVHPNAKQIQELPTNDKLLLSGHLEFDSTNAACGDIISTGGSDATFGIFNSTTVGNSSGITFHCRNNAGNASVNVADFKVGASNKIESVFKGEVTAVQPTCLLTVPKNYTATGTSNHIGGTNEQPISFTNTTTNVNCTTSLASNATVNSGISSITVPSAGTYLVTASISGKNTSTNSGNQTNNKDQVRLCLGKTGITTFPNTETFPASVFASDAEAEFNINFALPLTLSASDTLSIHFSHVGNSKASIEEGHFSVTKLH